MTGSNRQTPTAASSRHIGRATWIASGIGLAVVAVGVLVFVGGAEEDPSLVTSAMATAADPSGSALPVVDVYMTPTCGCCSKWVDHLREKGFEVRAMDMPDLTDVKARYSVPRQMESCHTALVAGYVLEGHVPAADVQRLLQERPAIAGLAVPGMPMGSPGMEVPGSNAQRYDVIAFRNDGSTHVFASYGH